MPLVSYCMLLAITVPPNVFNLFRNHSTFLHTEEAAFNSIDDSLLKSPPLNP